MCAWRLPAGLGTALALAAGAEFLPALSFPVALLLGGGGVVMLLARGRRPRSPAAPLWTLLAVAALGSSAGSLRAPAPRRPCPTPATDALLAGRVTAWELRPYGVMARLDLHRAGESRYPASVPVRLFAPSSWGAIPRSPWLAFSGALTPDRGATNPGAWVDPRTVGSLRPRVGASARWGPGTTPRLLAWRQSLAQRARAVLPGFPGRLAVGVLLGRSSALTPGERAIFRRTGTSHLVAVSGLHVGLVAGLALLILSGASRPLRFGGIAVVVWTYAALAGWSPSSVRAASIISLHGAGLLLARPRNGPAWLALAIPWLLWNDPGLLRSVSFLLSVGAVAGIFFLLEVVRPPARRGGRVLAAVTVSLGAQWGTLPTALCVFGAVSPLALLPNLLAVPLAALFLPAVLLALAFADIPGAGPLWADAARALGTAVGFAVRLGGEHLPFVSGWSAPPAAVLAIFPLILVGWFVLPAALRPRRAARIPAALLATCAVVLCFLPRPVAPGPWAAFLDVGQGDASIFRLADGTVWMVDTGDDRGPGDAAANAILPFLRAAHIREVDGLILTHRHRDHVGALAPLLEGVAVRRVYDAGHGPASGTSGQVDSILAAHDLWPCLVAAGDTIHESPTGLITARHPAGLERGSGPAARGLNDHSLVTRVTDGPLSILFAGDAEAGAETALIATEEPLDARLLQVGHHGSGTSSSAAFLRAVRPEWAVVSCGTGNRFGHPDPATVRRLREHGAVVHRTDLRGALWLRPDRDGGWIALDFPPAAAVERDSLSGEKPIW